MAGFLLVVSMIGFIVCIILLIIKLFKKSPLKKTAITLLSFIIMFFIGAVMLPSTPQESAVADESNELPEEEQIIQEETEVAEVEDALAAEAVEDMPEEKDEVMPIESVSLPSYRIIEVEDLSFSNVTRFNCQVVIDEPVEPEDIKQLAEFIVEEAKTTDSFNALSIMFYDYEEYIGFGYTLGKVEFAPGGEWSKANTVNAGDYHLMRYKYDLRPKDWSTQLTPQEVRAWREWEDTFDRLFDEEAAFAHIQKEFGLSREKAESIVNKQISWTFQNSQ